MRTRYVLNLRDYEQKLWTALTPHPDHERTVDYPRSGAVDERRVRVLPNLSGRRWNPSLSPLPPRTPTGGLS